MNYQNVFVYGSLRQGHGNHVLLEQDGAEYVSTHRVRLPFFMISLGGFPGLIKDDSGHYITGEIYRVDEHVMSDLDRLEGFPSFYNREQIEIDGTFCWIYFLNNSEHYSVRDRVTSGNWTQFVRGNDPAVPYDEVGYV